MSRKRADCKKAQVDAEWWLGYCYVIAMILVGYNSRICEVNNAKMSKKLLSPSDLFSFSFTPQIKAGPDSRGIK